MSIDNRKIVDPLGEIRRRAEELWREAGEPTGKSWEDYFATAEESLLGGGGGSAPSGRNREPAHRNLHHDMVLAPEFKPFIEQRENLLLSLIASALKQPLTDHDGLCLARLLCGSDLILRDQSDIRSITEQHVAAVLAHLSNEYDPVFLKKAGVSTAKDLTISKKVDYWADRISNMFKSDDALTYADRNTMARLSVAIAAEARIAELIYKEK